MGQKAKASFSFRKYFRSRKGQKWLVILAFTAIPLILLLVFTYIPFFRMVEFSFFDMSYTRNKGYVGIKNYQRFLSKSEYINTLKVSLYYMAGSIIQLALALYFATLLSFKTRCGGLFKGLIFFPYLVNGIALGFIFKFFYTHGYVLDSLLVALGADLDKLPYWLRDKSINNWSLVATSIWKYMGQNMVLFIGAIMSVDPELYEASSLDGANRWAQFRYIMLPSIKTIIMLNVIMSITGSLSAFEPPFVITGGGNGTATYFVKMDSVAHTDQKLGMACAMAVFLMIIIIVVAGLQKFFFSVVYKEDKDVDYRTRRRLERLRRKTGNQ